MNSLEYGPSTRWGRLVVPLIATMAAALASLSPGGAPDSVPRPEPGAEEWPFVMPTPQRARYGDLLPDRGWNWSEEGISKNLNLQIVGALGPNTATGRKLSFHLSRDIKHPQGYRLSVQAKGATIRAKSEVGLYYGLQSLRALRGLRGGAPVVRVAEIEDWPAFSTRGLIGYAPLAQRMGAMKFNLLQVPSGFGAFDRGKYRAMVEGCRRDYIRFLAQIGSRGRFWDRNAMLDFSEEAYRKVLDYYQSVYDLGVREFSVDFDDMDLPAGEGAALGEKHAETCRRVYDWLKGRDAKGRIFFCAIPYAGPNAGGAFTHSSPNDARAYLKVVGERLPDDARILWTGPDIYSGQITGAQADEYAALTGRKPFLWDNQSLPWLKRMQPLTARSADLADHVSGYEANMADPPESFNDALLPVVLTVADYVWNPGAYEPEVSLQRALKFVAGEKYPEASEAWAAARSACEARAKAQATSANRRSVPPARLAEGDVEKYRTRWRGALEGCANRDFGVAFVQRLDEMSKPPDRPVP